MTRIKRGFVSRRNHKKTLEANKGYRGSHSRLFKVANQENMKALKYAYFDRRKKKRSFKSLWIKKINAATRLFKQIKYNQFINKLKISNILINRKILATIAEFDRNSFVKITEK